MSVATEMTPTRSRGTGGGGGGWRKCSEGAPAHHVPVSKTVSSGSSSMTGADSKAPPRREPLFELLLRQYGQQEDQADGLPIPSHVAVAANDAGGRRRGSEPQTTTVVASSAPTTVDHVDLKPTSKAVCLLSLRA